MKTLLWFPCTLLTAVSGLVACSDSGTTPSSRLEPLPEIAFLSTRDTEPAFPIRRLYLMNPDGSDVRKLLDRGGPTMAWSSDAQRVAFPLHRADPDRHDLGVLTLANGDVQRIPVGHGYIQGAISWSPDGERLAFDSWAVENSYEVGIGDTEIYAIRVNGSDLRQLTANERYDSEPSWSPDGEWIVFASARDFPVESRRYDGYLDRSEIYLMRPDGSEPRRLTNDTIRDESPAWSPDGERIAFVKNFARSLNGRSGIFVMNTDGTGVVQLTHGSTHDGEPTWSPDGRQIAFQSRRDGNFEIYVIDVESRHQRRLTNRPGFDMNPEWRPRR